MILATWNINGIRSGQGKLKDFLKNYSPDILCLQEVKLDPQKKNEIDVAGYFEFYYYAQKKGYSGTAIFSKAKFQEVKEGIGVEGYDNEARVLVAKIKDIYVVSLYFPHSRRDLSRLDFKMDFNRKIESFVKKFPENKTILCGDFNVAHQEIDIARPKDNRKNAGFTDIERQWMSRFLSEGWVDVFRRKYPDKQIFSWWSNMRNARERNIGWRIDYFLVSPKIFTKVKDCQILTKVYGSDHCPIICEIK
jgi:exodeoxyribonuclease-3